jgi:hypothetical protein
VCGNVGKEQFKRIELDILYHQFHVSYLHYNFFIFKVNIEDIRKTHTHTHIYI